MPYKEFKVEKLYYSIGEVAEMFNVNTSLIRFWEKEFKILSPKKNKKGDRAFTKEDIENFKLIYHLVKEKGLKLEAAKTTIKNNRKQAQNNFEAIESLKRVKAFLKDLSNNL